MNLNEEKSHMYGKLSGLREAYSHFLLNGLSAKNFKELENEYLEILHKLSKSAKKIKNSSLKTVK